MAFTLSSPAFHDNGTIPPRFTCDGDNTAPELRVGNPPPGTKSFALIADDPDAPHGTFTHWVAYDIPPESADLQAGDGKMLRNSFGRAEYGGPCPPREDEAHHYHFTVYAVDTPSLHVKGEDRRALEEALRSHTLGTARLTAQYRRPGR
jgi:Raf kinase inhibitor-like YbhB/YbcL family protein